MTPRVTHMERVLIEYGKVQERFETLGVYPLGHRVEAVLGGLGFGPAWYDVEVGTLSGGEKKLVMHLYPGNYSYYFAAKICLL